MSQNVFADEWRECLRAHYLHVVRIQDKVTEPSLTLVMREAGFSEAELRDLRLRGTLRADDVGENFVPDLEILESLSPPAPLLQEEGSGEAQVFAVPQRPEPVVEATEAEPVIDESEFTEDDIEPPQQLSLF